MNNIIHIYIAMSYDEDTYLKLETYFNSFYNAIKEKRKLYIENVCRDYSHILIEALIENSEKRIDLFFDEFDDVIFKTSLTDKLLRKALRGIEVNLAFRSPINESVEKKFGKYFNIYWNKNIFGRHFCVMDSISYWSEDDKNSLTAYGMSMEETVAPKFHILFDKVCKHEND